MTQILFGWLALSVATLLAFSGGTLAYALITSLRAKFPGALPAVDINMFILWQYNFAMVGVACVFWKSPLIVKQVYLILASCIMAWSEAPSTMPPPPILPAPSTLRNTRPSFCWPIPHPRPNTAAHSTPMGAPPSPCQPFR